MLASHSMFENERRELDSFNRAMVKRIEAVHTLAGKQEIMRTLYDRFFSQAFPRMSERLHRLHAHRGRRLHHPQRG